MYQAAQEIGGVDNFDQEYPCILALIQNDVDLARHLGVKGTPTFFINGVRVEGWLKPDLLDRAIAHELRMRSAKP